MSDNKGILAPSTDNYLVGKGFLIFKPVGEADFFHLGNVPSFEFTPTVELLDHFSSMGGTKERDLRIVTQKLATLKIVMEEFTKRNLGLMLMGDVDDSDPTDIVVNVFSTTALTGELRFYATNDVGPRWRFFLNKVQFTPGGSFSPISDGINSMTVTGDVYAVDGVWGEAHLITATIPVNVTLPFLVGTLADGEIISVSNGGWLDADSFTYQWKNAGVNILGETNKTYTIVTGDVGDLLSCVVTGVNESGSASATSIAADPVTT